MTSPSLNFVHKYNFSNSNVYLNINLEQCVSFTANQRIRIFELLVTPICVMAAMLDKHFPIAAILWESWQHAVKNSNATHWPPNVGDPWVRLRQMSQRPHHMLYDWMEI